MQNLNKYSGTVITVLAVAVVVLAVLLLSQNGGGTPPATNTQSPSTSASSTAPAQTPTQGSVSSPPTATKPAATGFAIRFVTPVAGDVWPIAQSHPITWSREAGVTGQIELLDATTKDLVGVILNQTGPHQTSYAWNTRDIFLSRTNPFKKNVVPGNYVIRVAFDGNNLSPITSAQITITQ